MLENPFQNIALIIPEIFLFGIFIGNVLVDLIFGKINKTIPLAFGIIGIITAIVLVINQYHLTLPLQPFFYKMLYINRSYIFIKIILGLVSLFTLVWINISKRSIKLAIPEVQGFIIASYLGACIMVEASHFMSLILGLEIVSISSYILAHFSFNKKGAESSLKYFLFGAFSTGLMIYGISFMYGFGGSFYFYETDFANKLAQAPAFFLVFSITLFLGGLFFKVALFPFHIWAPDVYEGAPTAIVAYFSVLPKIAGLAVLCNIYEVFVINPVLQSIMIFVLSAVAIASILVGNLSALWQNNFKRMMAYSSIAQAGFILAAILPHNSYSSTSFLFYLSIYFFMNFGAFFMGELLFGKQDEFHLKQLSGLGRRQPLLGIMLLIIMVSLVGLPPTSGFSAKFLLFTSLYEFSQNTNNHLILALFLVAVVNTVISLFFYLKPLYFLFLKPTENQTLVIFELKGKLFCIIIVLPLIIGFFSFDKFVHLIQQLNGF